MLKRPEQQLTFVVYIEPIYDSQCNSSVLGEFMS